MWGPTAVCSEGSRKVGWSTFPDATTTLTTTVYTVYKKLPLFLYSLLWGALVSHHLSKMLWHNLAASLLCKRFVAIDVRVCILMYLQIHIYIYMCVCLCVYVWGIWGIGMQMAKRLQHLLIIGLRQSNQIAEIANALHTLKEFK